MTNDCLICQRIESIKNGTNPYFVKELETGYVVIGDYQTYPGYSLFLCKIHTDELHKLDHTFKVKFLEEMSLVGEAVYWAFGADKMNYELLGNTEKSHLHWHFFPRRNSDPGPCGPVWVRGREVVFDENSKPTPTKLITLQQTLLMVLTKLVEQC